MLLMLCSGNLLSSYVYQFAVLIQVTLQMITLGYWCAGTGGIDLRL